LAEKKFKFLVVFFSKNKRLFAALAALTAIVAAVCVIVAFTDWIVTVKKEQALPWTVVLEEADWKGVPADASLPRYFVAGGTAFDRQILVDGWGMPEEILTPVDYMEELGIHVLMGEVTQVLYGGNKLQVYVDEKESGYQLVTIAKGNLTEGDLQIIFLNNQGAKIGYEEEYVYSVPLEYTLVDSGALDTKGGVFMEVLDTETLPALTDYAPNFLSQHSGSLLLYIQGAKVTTIQRNDTTIRIYTEDDPGFQVVALETKLMQPGQNTVRLIDSASLQVISQLIYLVSD
jgi:hypothetical protein